MSEKPPRRHTSTTTPIHKVAMLPVPGTAAVGSPVDIFVAVEAGSVLSGNSVALGRGTCVVGIRMGCGVLALGTNLKEQVPASSSAHHLAR